ncbi:MAG: DUF1592 domain-containing protein [Polyangiaceae bacterium]
MSSLGVRRAFSALAVLVSAAACSGTIDAGPGGSGSNSTAGGNPNAGSGNIGGSATPGGGNGAGGGGGSGSTAGSGSGNTTSTGSTASTSAGGSVPLPGGVDAATLIPERIRRLANAEFDASVKGLTGTGMSPGAKFAPDARQAGFTLNDAQRVDNVTAKQIYQAATDIAAEFDVTTKAPCADMTKAETCAQSFIASFGAKAYRRPLSTEEAAGLLTVYQTAVSDGAYADGIRLVLRALINSAGFLYLTELGDGAAVASGSGVALTPYELASSLSYLVTNAPPTDQLMSDALAGKLATPEGREAAFWALITTPAAKDRVIRVMREWLGTDRIGDTDKDATIYPKFAGLKAAMVTESSTFIEKVITEGTGTIDQLLSADWTYADSNLATLYGASGSGKVTLPTRRGILNQAAFLSVFAHAHESSPVLRGVEIARRLACVPIASPSTLNIVVVPPAPESQANHAAALRRPLHRRGVQELPRDHRQPRLRLRRVRRHGPASAPPTASAAPTTTSTAR